MDNKHWRDRLKSLREKKGLTQEQLEKLSGVSQSQINLLENGKRLFTQKTLEKLLIALRADYQDLFCPGIDELKEYLGNIRSTDKSKIISKDRKIPAEVIRLISRKD